MTFRSPLIAGTTSLVLVALAAAPAAAATPTPETTSPLGERTPVDLPAEGVQRFEAAGGASSSIVRTIVGLAIVLAVIYGLAWVMKQVKASRETASAGVGLSSEASLALGPNRSVHLIRTGSELVLVGVAEHGVTPIRTYTEEEARAVGLLTDDPAPGAPAAGSAFAASPVGGLVERLRQLTVRP